MLVSLWFLEGEIPVDENSDTREVPAATPWDQPPPPPSPESGSGWGSPPPPPPPPPPPAAPVAGVTPGGKKPKRRLGLIIAIVGGLLLLAALAFLAVVGVFYSRMAGSGGRGLDNYTLVEEEPGKGKDRILLVRVEGVITSGQGAAPEVIAQLRQLRKYGRPKNVTTVLLRVNSPGGTVTACDVIDNEVQKCKEAGYKFVAFYDEVAASGGYYVSARSDHIVARPTCITGSIGVIGMSFNLKRLLNEKLGIETQIMKSVPFKDVPSMFRPMTDEEKTYMQKIITDYHARFVNIVKTGRKLSDAEVAAFADGRVFLAADALRLKMIDEIGHWDAAIAAARKLTGPDAPIVSYRRKPNPLKLLLQAKSGTGLPRDLRLKLEVVAQQRFCYLWLP